jgi:hypothetical protein
MRKSGRRTRWPAALYALLVVRHANAGLRLRSVFRHIGALHRDRVSSPLACAVTFRTQFDIQGSGYREIRRGVATTAAGWWFIAGDRDDTTNRIRIAGVMN